MDLTWMSARKIVELIARKEISPVEVVDFFLDRIAAVDPIVHAFYTVDAQRARAQAREAERAVAEGRTLGILHGLPISVPDVENVKGLPNPMWGAEPATHDDLSVERLRKAGAIIIGTTHTYHWDVLERPRNPWNLDREPGNSNRGAGAAVAAGMLPAVVSLDGAGSTRLPAAWNGVIGMFPSRGLIPQLNRDSPHLEMTMQRCQMAREATDIALILQALAGPDGRDLVSTQIDPPDYLAHIEDGVAGVRVAWTDDFGWSRTVWVDETPELVEIAKKSAFSIAADGAEVREIDQKWEPAAAATLTLMGVFEESSFIAPISPVDNAERQIAVDEAWGVPEGVEVDYTLASRPKPTSADTVAAIDSRQRNWQAFRNVFAEYDVILSLTTPMEPRTFKEWGLMGRDYLFTSYSAHTVANNLLGIPAASVPCGFVRGLPVGLQVTAKPGREDLILRVVQAIARRQPVGEYPQYP